MLNKKTALALLLIIVLMVVLAGCQKEDPQNKLAQAEKEVAQKAASANAQGIDPQYQRDVSNLKLELKKNPKDADTMVELGNLYIDNFEYTKAIDMYTQALEYKKDNAALRTDLGSAYYRLGMLEQALEYFKEATEADPKHAQAWYNIGVVYHVQEKRQETIDAWETYLKVETDEEKKKPIQLEVEKLRNGEPFNKPAEEDPAATQGSPSSPM